MALGLCWDPTKILIAHGTERRMQELSLLNRMWCSWPGLIRAMRALLLADRRG